MLESVKDIIFIMGWMGVVLALLTFVNIACNTVYNITTKKEKFDWKKMLLGIGKILIFYTSSIFTAIAFTMLPFINSMISDMFGVQLISNEILETLSSTGVLGVCIMVIITYGFKAFEGIKNLGDVKSSNEIITWEVKDE